MKKIELPDEIAELHRKALELGDPEMLMAGLQGFYQNFASSRWATSRATAEEERKRRERSEAVMAADDRFAWADCPDDCKEVSITIVGTPTDPTPAAAIAMAKGHWAVKSWVQHDIYPGKLRLFVSAVNSAGEWLHKDVINQRLADLNSDLRRIRTPGEWGFVQRAKVVEAST
jgi:hypothetical protein